ncbi:hypothetical protein FRB99_004455, partial [Tulasnella sp. 403]
ATLHHQEKLPVAIQRALQEAGKTIHEIDGIAFTRGPGMSTCLSVCANAGRGIAAALHKPVVGVHHMAAHALTVLLTTENPPGFPYLTLLVSGGHTMLVLVYSPQKFKILADTVDIAAGQAIDSVARLLKLSWTLPDGTLIGGGAALERLAASHTDLPLPTLKPFPKANEGLLSFSFAGPKSRVHDLLARTPSETLDSDTPFRIAVARNFQQAIADQLVEKVGLALRRCDVKGVSVTSLVVGGGVASNRYFRSRWDRVPYSKNGFTISRPESRSSVLRHIYAQ